MDSAISIFEVARAKFLHHLEWKATSYRCGLLGTRPWCPACSSLPRMEHTFTCTKGKALVGTMSGHGSWVLSIDVSPDGLESSIGSSNRTVMLWDLGIRASVQTMKNHSDQAWAVVFRLHRGGNFQGGRVSKADVWLAFPTTLYDYS